MSDILSSISYWLALLFLFAVILAMRPAFAEPGDKYDFPIRQSKPLANKAAGGRLSPPVYPATIGGRPSQCPRRFCGCDLSLEIFGRADPALYPAKAWFRFPRSRPAPGMVAVRKHHVFRLIAHVRGNVWLSRDPNSGGGLTRIHERSIAGFVIVNPNARMASR